MCVSKTNQFLASVTHVSNTHIKKWAMEKKENGDSQLHTLYQKIPNLYNI